MLLFGAEEPEEPSLPPDAVEGLPCAEDGCTGTLRLRTATRHTGYFYSCVRWPDCEGTLPADRNGKPHGKPRKKSLQRARKAAHEAFDPIWQTVRPNGRRVKRSVAYLWLQEVMEMSAEEAHMFCMTEEECRRVVREVEAKGPGTPFWDAWWSTLGAQHRKPAQGRTSRGGDTPCPLCNRVLRGHRGLVDHVLAMHVDGYRVRIAETPCHVCRVKPGQLHEDFCSVGG